MIIERVVNQLKDDEGFRANVYKDTKGNETIGYGHKVLYGEDWSDGLTHGEAYDLLITDIHKTVKNMNIVFPWWGNLPEDAQDAFVNMCFNMGCDTVLTFHTFLDLLRAGMYAKSADDLIHTKWQKDVGDRATRIETVFRSLGDARGNADAGPADQDSA